MNRGETLNNMKKLILPKKKRKHRYKVSFIEYIEDNELEELNKVLDEIV